MLGLISKTSDLISGIGNIGSAVKGFKETEGNFIDKIKGAASATTNQGDLSSTNEKLDQIAGSLSNIENNSDMNNITNNSAIGNIPPVVNSKKSLQKIDTIVDPLKQRVSEADRYQQFNSLAMDGIGGEEKMGFMQKDQKQKDKAAKELAAGIGEGFNTYAKSLSAIAQADDWWNKDKTKSKTLGEFTIDVNKGDNNNANITKGKGTIKPSSRKTYDPDGNLITSSRKIEASF